LKGYQNELEGLGKKERKEKEKEIYQSESVITRKLREKIMKKDFHSVKLIGRGAFGEVRLSAQFGSDIKKTSTLIPCAFFTAPQISAPIHLIAPLLFILSTLLNINSFSGSIGTKNR
jgi:hypothetical protein